MEHTACWQHTPAGLGHRSSLLHQQKNNSLIHETKCPSVVPFLSIGLIFHRHDLGLKARLLHLFPQNFLGVGTWGWEPGGQHFKKAVAEVAMTELICVLCHCKDNNYAYIFVTACIIQF